MYSFWAKRIQESLAAVRQGGTDEIEVIGLSLGGLSSSCPTKEMLAQLLQILALKQINNT